MFSVVLFDNAILNMYFTIIGINPIFEGASGRERLNLQKKYKGDQRFKLTQEFMNDKDKGEVTETRVASGGDNLSQVLSGEKSKNLDILKDMFGTDTKVPKQKKYSTKNLLGLISASDIN